MKFFLNLKHKFPRFWNALETVNGWCVSMRYGNVERYAEDTLQLLKVSGYRFSLASESDVPALAEMLAGASAHYTRNFQPHRFDTETMRRLFHNPSFMMMKAEDRDGELVGYFFIRFFVVGKAFHGLFVKESHANRGLGSEMWRLSSIICSKAGLKMFATISNENIASITSLRRGCNILEPKPINSEYCLYEICMLDKNQTLRLHPSHLEHGELVLN